MFSQVHLICMPHSDDNICERSSKFHFVNDFLYKEVGDHPENRSYIERYYPQGYEGGIANIPDHKDGGPPPQAAKPSQYHRPITEGRQGPPRGYHTRDQQQNFRPQEETLQYLPQQFHHQQQREEERRHPSQFRQRQQQQQNLQSLDPRPHREASINEQVFHKQANLQSIHEGRKPQLQDENRKFQLTKPQFEQESPLFEPERPRFEGATSYSNEHPPLPADKSTESNHEPLQPPEAPHPFKPFLRNSQQPSEHSSEGRPRFNLQQRPPHHEDENRPQRLEEFVEGPSAHFQQHRPKPVSYEELPIFSSIDRSR